MVEATHTGPELSPMQVHRETGRLLESFSTALPRINQFNTALGRKFVRGHLSEITPIPFSVDGYRYYVSIDHDYPESDITRLNIVRHELEAPRVTEELSLNYPTFPSERGIGFGSVKYEHKMGNDINESHKNTEIAVEKAENILTHLQQHSTPLK